MNHLTDDKINQLRDEYMAEWKKNNLNYPEKDYWSGVNDGMYKMARHLKELSAGEPTNIESIAQQLLDYDPESAIWGAIALLQEPQDLSKYPENWPQGLFANRPKEKRYVIAMALIATELDKMKAFQ